MLKGLKKERALIQKLGGQLEEVIKIESSRKEHEADKQSKDPTKICFS